ncbi:retrograde regulation protein 2 [Aspergillus sclerotialis]|uniref:Retrograde regulation protein 2 n=1 Tax=Aspergillus sclerotialis TaxID=2070753 RepID=A0A3A2ZYN8_9EURO|nr:retrograde regulation protein 2 [Aspergillus sclerotialis]
MSTDTSSTDMHRYAVVDMGSNGIRFTITNLAPPTGRNMPTLFHDRAGISLHDAQFTSSGEKCPIPEDIIKRVITRFLRFKITCQDFGVPAENIYVLATEATRTASNSEEFRRRITERTGWEVQLLSKEEEGRIACSGVASSGRRVRGLVMDLGGGSVQLSWVVERNGVVETCEKGSFSFPYGAAALVKRLEGLKGEDNGKSKKKDSEKGAEDELKEEMKGKFRRAFSQLDLPEELRDGGFNLYLSGGGFRGWGYLLMSQARVDPYPIPIINGYRASKSEFHDMKLVLNAVSDDKDKVYGMSKRRASQIPAVAVLVNVVVDAIPMIKNIQFCQGGIREGFLFNKLPVEIRAQDPLLAATLQYAPPSRDLIKDLLQSVLPATPSSISSSRPPESISPIFLTSLANLLYVHSNTPKETRTATALHSTTTGILASTNNLTHIDRALLALILAEGWTGDLTSADETFRDRLRMCISPQEAWWARYLGRVAAMICDVYPSGVVPDPWRIRLETEWQCGIKKKETCDFLRLKVRCNNVVEGEVMREVLVDTAEWIEKLGKKKKWVDGYGVRLVVEVLY